MAIHAMRVEIRDQPGALAAVGSAVAGCGGNIVDVDVHELDGEHVADEIVVDLPGGVSPGMLRQALLAAGATSVVSTSVHHRGMDAVVRTLDGALRLVAGAARDVPLGDLAGALARIVTLDEVVVVPKAEAAEGSVAWRALAMGVPVAEHDDPAWVVALPFPEATPGAVLVVTRRSVRFSSTELARLRAAVRLWAAARERPVVSPA